MNILQKLLQNIKKDETVYITAENKTHLNTAIKSLNNYGASINSSVETIIKSKPDYIDPKYADVLSRFGNISKPSTGVYGIGIGAELCFGLAVSGQCYFVIDSKGNKGILVIGGVGGGFGGGAMVDTLRYPSMSSILDLEDE